MLYDIWKLYNFFLLLEGCCIYALRSHSPLHALFSYEKRFQRTRGVCITSFAELIVVHKLILGFRRMWICMMVDNSYFFQRQLFHQTIMETFFVTMYFYTSFVLD